MKKEYKAPIINKVMACTDDPFMKASNPGHQSGDIFDGTHIGSGTGQDGDEGYSKTSGRFWDDEY